MSKNNSIIKPTSEHMARKKKEKIARQLARKSNKLLDNASEQESSWDEISEILGMIHSFSDLTNKTISGALSIHEKHPIENYEAMVNDIVDKVETQTLPLKRLIAEVKPFLDRADRTIKTEDEQIMFIDACGKVQRLMVNFVSIVNTEVHALTAAANKVGIEHGIIEPKEKQSTPVEETKTEEVKEETSNVSNVSGDE